MLKIFNPSTVVAKSLQGILEIILRGSSIVLSLVCIAAASPYFGLLANLCSTVDTIREIAAQNPSIIVVVGTCKELKYMIMMMTSSQSRAFGFDKKSAAGWIIFLSILVIIYQILAFLQLFLHFKLLHIKIPFLKTFWTLFFIIDIVAMAVFAFFYFCGATAVAVLARSWKELIDVYRGDAYRRDYYVAIADCAMKVYSATVAISVLSFIAMVLYIGAVVYFLMAKLLLKKATHGAEILLLAIEEEGVKSEE